jgi:hypothetical protein
LKDIRDRKWLIDKRTETNRTRYSTFSQSLYGLSWS